MLYLILVGISGFIFAALLIGFRHHFFKALESAVGLSNAVLSDQDDLIKQKGILNALNNSCHSIKSNIRFLKLQEINQSIDVKDLLIIENRNIQSILLLTDLLQEEVEMDLGKERILGDSEIIEISITIDECIIRVN